jgi:hypothetical protein
MYFKTLKGFSRKFEVLENLKDIFKNYLNIDITR